MRSVLCLHSPLPGHICDMLGIEHRSTTENTRHSRAIRQMEAAAAAVVVMDLVLRRCPQASTAAMLAPQSERQHDG